MADIHEGTDCEDEECRKWAALCKPENAWQSDLLTHYGADKMVYPKSFSKWMKFIQNMNVRPDDVWVLTHPKCGTTWAQEMLWLLGNDLDFDRANSVYIEQRFPFLDYDTMAHFLYQHTHHYEDTKDSGAVKPTSMEIIDKMPSPRFIKSHFPLSLLPRDILQSGAKLVFITRNPKDVCVSYYHFCTYAFGYQGTLDQFSESFVTDQAVLWAPFWPRVKAFHNLHLEGHPNLLFLTYEEMKRDLKGVIRKAGKFLGKRELTEEELERLAKHLSFEEMRKNPRVNKDGKVDDTIKMTKTPFMRKGQVGSWKEEMSPEFVVKFDEWMEKNKIEGLF